jgi:hypothetical protein
VVTMKNGVFWDVRRVALVRTDLSGELNTSIIRVTRSGELGTTLAATSNRRTLLWLLNFDVTCPQKSLNSNKMKQ